MLEDVIFSQLTMPGELVRLVIAFLGVLVATYYDLFNKKNIPDLFLYSFLLIAFLINLLFYEETLFIFSLAIAVVVSGIGYIFYRVGQLGGADVFILAGIMLLLPIHPSFSEMTFNIPFVFSIIIFSGVVFALYMMVYFGFKLLNTEAKPNLLYLLMLVPYGLFAYVYLGSFLFSPLYFAFITISMFAITLFMMFKESVNKLLAEELPLSQLEPEDVLALELMNKDLVEKHKLTRLVTENEIARLKKAKLTEVWVYTKLPPFVPFILVGMVMSLFFAKHLLLF
ncbi:MAG: prepilin peptidase [Candidatus Micrarchaeota archaeon]